MFRWYAQADKCYVFLSDVPRGQKLGADWEQDFRGSAWFTRGWTLQELIASSKLEFYSKHGHLLGTKQSLERWINEITRIPVTALRKFAHADFTVHERRQWQEGRETQRPEDLVYALLGLLDISMPVLYGEGRKKAEQRLEHEINVAEKGWRYRDFSLTFGLAAAAVETQHFVARQEYLQEIHDHLHTDGSRNVVVLHGLGGIGKTQLGMAYAKRHKDGYSAVLWLNAASNDSLESSFARIAKQIVREQPHTAPRLAGLSMDKNLAEVVAEVKAWLSMPTNTRWLMIYDNYDNPKVPGSTDPATIDLRGYLPEAYQGSILVTTRSAEVELGHCINIRKLDSLQDSLQILENSSKRKGLADDSSAIELARRLDGLPLGLATAGAYLSQSAMPFRKYLDLYTHSWARLQQKTRMLLTYEDRTLYTTWQMSFDQVERRSSTAANLLRLWAYFDQQDLWFELLDHVDENSPPWTSALVADELAFEECVQLLCDHGMVEVHAPHELEVDSTGYSVHVCVHEWMSAVLNSTADEQMARHALRCVGVHLPDVDAANWSLLHRRMLNHANRVYHYTIKFVKDDSTLRWVLNNLGLLYQYQGRFSESQESHARALRIKEKTLGTDDPARWTGCSCHYLRSEHPQRSTTLPFDRMPHLQSLMPNKSNVTCRPMLPNLRLQSRGVWKSQKSPQKKTLLLTRPCYVR